MRKLILAFTFVVIAGLGNYLEGQEVKSISQTRKDNLMTLLNYRFKGGVLYF